MGTIVANSSDTELQLSFIVDDFELWQLPVRGSKADPVAKDFAFMFVFESSLLDETIDPVIESVHSLMDASFLCLCIIIMLAMIGIVLYVVFEVADLTTRPIVELNQRIQVVLDSVRVKGEGGTFNLMYNYVERSAEINELYLSISKTTKVLQFAGLSQYKEND